MNMLYVHDIIKHGGKDMRLLFCNITWLDYYKGVFPGVDTPKGSADFNKTGREALEQYNFERVALNFYEGPFESGDYCLGYVEIKPAKANKNQLLIENINGCEDFINQDFVEDVLVIYCANHPAHNFTTIVGWYKHATVYRYYQEVEFPTGDEGEGIYVQSYNAIAKAEDCVLLPRRERSNKPKWSVPRKQSGTSYGFGQSSLWFAEKEEENTYLETYLDRIVKQIEEYDGENWLDQYPNSNT